MPVTAINAVLLHTQDVERLVDFYRDTVGLPMRSSDHGGGMHGEAHPRLGDVHFAIFPGGPEPGRGPVTISLHVDDLQGEYERLLALGVEFEHPPQPKPFGGIVAPFRDPDGNGVLLMSWQPPA